MKFKILAYLISFAIVSEQAEAAFYIEDTFHQNAQQIATDRPLVTSYDIPFFIRRTQFGPLGRRAMQTLLPEAQKAEGITIIGHKDQYTAPNEAIAQQRAFRIRQWLIDNGVPAHKIKLRDDSTIKPSSAKYVFNSEILLFKRENSRELAPDHLHTSNMIRSAHNPYAHDTQMNASFDDSTKLALASKILALGQNKLVQPEYVIKLLTELLQNAPTSAPAPQQFSSQQSLPAAIVRAEEDPIRTWTLNSNKSLRANLEDWISQANWNKLDWQPANPYQITFSSTLQGTLLEVLGQIAKAIPELDLQVSRSKREIRVIQSGQ